MCSLSTRLCGARMIRQPYQVPSSPAHLHFSKVHQIMTNILHFLVCPLSFRSRRLQKKQKGQEVPIRPSARSNTPQRSAHFHHVTILEKQHAPFIQHNKFIHSRRMDLAILGEKLIYFWFLVETDRCSSLNPLLALATTPDHFALQSSGSNLQKQYQQRSSTLLHLRTDHAIEIRTVTWSYNGLHPLATTCCTIAAPDIAPISQLMILAQSCRTKFDDHWSKDS